VKRYSEGEIISEINNGNRDILVYLARKYFPSSRRLLRIKGFDDDQTPGIFADVLVKAYLKLQQQQLEYIDFESYFVHALNDHIRILKEQGKDVDDSNPGQPVNIVSQCVSIMDEQSQQLLYSRVAGKMSYEQIRNKFQFSNPVIAQYEVNKALNQLEGIVKLRMNFS
jgi:hypothetical protein